MRISPQFSRRWIFQRVFDCAVGTVTGCTDWLGQVDKNGYPKFNGAHNSRVGRHLWVAVHQEPIPDGLWILHTCDNPRCLRMDHLVLGTPKQNTQDAVGRGRLKGARRLVTVELAEEINRMRRSGYKVTEICRHTSLNRATVTAYCDTDLRRQGEFRTGPEHHMWTDGASVAKTKRVVRRVRPHA